MQPLARTLLTVALVALAACGGAEPDNARTLQDQAIAQRVAATAAAQPGPCTTDIQCAYATFFEPFHSCSQGIYVPYLKASRSAHWLVDAAAAQRATALQARALLPPPNFFCTLSVDIVNSVCVQSSCAIKLGGPTITIEVPG